MKMSHSEGTRKLCPWFIFLGLTQILFNFVVICETGFVIIVKQENSETKAKISSVYATNWEEIKTIKKPATTATATTSSKSDSPQTMEISEMVSASKFEATTKDFKLSTTGTTAMIEKKTTADAFKSDITESTAMIQGPTTDALKQDTTELATMIEKRTTTDALKHDTIGTTAMIPRPNNRCFEARHHRNTSND
jgi:hypothetical protein